MKRLLLVCVMMLCLATVAIAKSDTISSFDFRAMVSIAVLSCISQTSPKSAVIGIFLQCPAETIPFE